MIIGSYGATTVIMGTSTVFQIDIFTPPGSVLTYTLHVRVPEGAFLCDIHVISGGEFTPCLHDIGNRTFGQKDSLGWYREVIFDIGTIPNTADIGDIFSEDNKVNKYRLALILQTEHP